MNFKKKMTNVYKQQVDDLEMLVPNFKIASAIIHYDETSPHMHIVGVPVKEKNKYGMELQVGKSDVFTKDSLKVLQDKMRTLCIEEFKVSLEINLLGLFTRYTKLSLSSRSSARRQHACSERARNWAPCRQEPRRRKRRMPANLANPSVFVSKSATISSTISTMPR